MILLYTDFGTNGPYVGQIKAVLAAAAPDVPVIDLMHDAPAFNPRSAGYLLAALVERLPPGTVVLGVVDPEVGDRARRPVAVRADGRWFVGPDNGLLAIAARRAGVAEWRRITWRPDKLSASFHGRDLFAPVAARLARGEEVPGARLDAGQAVGAGWPDDLAEIVYLDSFGNAITGLRAGAVAPSARLAAGGRRLERATTFADVPAGTAMWYENSLGLVEIAVNKGSAARRLGLRIGATVAVSGA